MTLESTFQQIENVNQIILAGLLILGGCIVTFWGSKLFKQLIFFVGFVAGTLFTYFLINNIDIDTTLRIHLLVSCGVGLFIGFICVMVYKMAVFTTGAIAGLIIAQFVWQFVVTNFPHSFLMQRAEIYNTVFIIVAAILGGFAAFKCIDVLLRGLTAFIGSFMVTSGVAYFVAVNLSNNRREWPCAILCKYAGEKNANVMNVVDYFETNKDIHSLESQCHTECYISLGVWAVLFLSGALYQYKCHKLKKKSKDNARYSESLQSEEEVKHVVINHNHYHQLRVNSSAMC